MPLLQPQSGRPAPAASAPGGGRSSSSLNLTTREAEGAAYQPLSGGDNAPILPPPAEGSIDLHAAKPGVDVGFAESGFDYGVISELFGTAREEQLSDSHPRRSAGSRLRSGLVVGLASVVPVVGWGYLAGVSKVVPATHIGVARTYTGDALLLPPGRCYTASAVGVTITLHELATLEHVSVGPLHIVRVRPGYIGIGSLGGSPIVLHAGLHVIEDSPSFSFVRMAALTQQEIIYGSLHILTVPSDRIARCLVGGTPHFLHAGRHVINSPLFNYKDSVPASSSNINLGARYRIRVEAGQFACIVTDGQPQILPARSAPYCFFNSTLEFLGLHDTQTAHVAAKTLHRICIPKGKVGKAVRDGKGVLYLHGEPEEIDDPRFQWHGLSNADEPHIMVGSLHRVVVRKGQIGKMLTKDEAKFLEGPDVVIIDDEVAEFQGFDPASAEHIQVADAHRILVPAGRIGLAMDDGKAKFLQAGEVHVIRSPSFVYHGSRSLADAVIQHGEQTIVSCRGGHFGVSYDDGKLTVLGSGRHTLNKATWTFAGFIPTSIQLLQFKAAASSSDNVPLEFEAAVSARIVDPEAAVLTLADLESTESSGEGSVAFDWRSIFERVKQQAHLALSIVVSNSHFASVGRAQRRKVHSDVTYAGAMDSESNAPSGSPADDSGMAVDADMGTDPSGDVGAFRHAVHDNFMASFGAQLREAGVELIELSIEELHVCDPELSASLSAGAIARAKLDQARVGLEQQRQEAVMKRMLQKQDQEQELALARSRQIAEIRLAQEKAEAQAHMRKTQVESDTAAAKATAEAEQAAAVARATGEAKAKELLAQAEAGRLRALNEAMRDAPEAVSQRELATVVMDGAAKALNSTNTSLVLAPSLQDATTFLYSGLFSEGSAMGRQLMSAASMPKDGRAWHAASPAAPMSSPK